MPAQVRAKGSCHPVIPSAAESKDVQGGNQGTPMISGAEGKVADPQKTVAERGKTRKRQQKSEEWGTDSSQKKKRKNSSPPTKDSAGERIGH